MPEEISRNTDSLTDVIWHRSFNLDYWHMRLTRIETDNSQEEKEEAFYLLLQLTDLYAHIITAQLEEPRDVWNNLKNSRTGDIRRVLSEYEDEDSQFKYNLEKHSEDDVLANCIELPEELEEEADDHQKAAIGLGCPIDLEDEETSVSFEDNPEKYIEISNFFVGFWKRMYDEHELYKDYKHGFRHPRFNEETMDYIEETVPAIGEAQEGIWEDVRERVNDEETILFFQLEETDEDSHILRVFEAEPEPSLYLAKTVFCLLNNLFNNGQSLGVEDDFNSALDDDGSLPDIYRVLFNTEIFLEPDAVPESLSSRMPDIDSDT